MVSTNHIITYWRYSKGPQRQTWKGWKVFNTKLKAWIKKCRFLQTVTECMSDKRSKLTNACFRVNGGINCILSYKSSTEDWVFRPKAAALCIWSTKMSSDYITDTVHVWGPNEAVPVFDLSGCCKSIHFVPLPSVIVLRWMLLWRVQTTQVTDQKTNSNHSNFFIPWK